MSVIYDLEFPTATPDPRPSRAGRSRIETDGPLLPRVIATGVYEEASVWLGEQLPGDWVAELADRAEAVYAANPRFRRLLRRRGNAGRDWLWAFARHWLAARIHQHRPDLHARLPSSYNIGHPLPGHAF